MFIGYTNVNPDVYFTVDHTKSQDTTVTNYLGNALKIIKPKILNL